MISWNKLKLLTETFIFLVFELILDFLLKFLKGVVIVEIGRVIYYSFNQTSSHLCATLESIFLRTENTDINKSQF